MSEIEHLSDDFEKCTPPDIVAIAKATVQNLLPEKSKKKYETVYRAFMDWHNLKKANSFSENVLLAYFTELSDKYKLSSLWSQYSMLKSNINIHHNINIENYSKLVSFLKRKSEGYQPKKALTLAPKEIEQFINQAPDEIYLATKVALIMGIMGACRAQELHSMTIEDLQDLGSAFLVTVPKTNTKVVRKFTITDNYYLICKKYADLRPKHLELKSFFINYQKGRCTTQKIGINILGEMGKAIAKFLKLPNPDLYTGQCFRRSSATLLVDGGGDLTCLKRHGGWKSTSVAEGYIDDSLQNKMATAKKILNSVDQNSTTTTTYTENQSTNRNISTTVDLDSKASINFQNCSNFTINFQTNK